jgi:predicted DNA-binding transcriptional regulator YafY
VTARTLVSPHAVVPRVERHHALLELLRIRAPRSVTADWLATELGVSARTIERDVADLHAAGVPVHVTRGPGGGYAMTSRGALPPIDFSPGEAAALVAALVAIGPSASATAQSAMTKLLDAMSDDP